MHHDPIICSILILATVLAHLVDNLITIILWKTHCLNDGRVDSICHSFNIFLTLYIGINLIGGERGLISYFDKKKIYEELVIKEKILTSQIEDLENKISLIENNDLDYLDMIYRKNFKYGSKDEIIIKIK